MTQIYNRRIPLTLLLGVLLFTLLLGGYAVAVEETETDAEAPASEVQASEFPDSQTAETPATENGYTLIYDAEGLKAIARDLSGAYRLAADIDLSLESNWLPIAQNEKFTGTLEGAGYTIYGLNSQRDTDRFAGLFGRVGPGGVVANLNLSSANVTGAYNVGAVVGYLEGDLINCNVFGLYTKISGNTEAMYVGGLAGYIGENGRISNSTFSGSVTAQDNAVVGGIAGYVYGGSLTACSVDDAQISGGVQSFAGGLAGFLNVSSVEQSYAATTVSAGGSSRTGGLIGGISAGSTVFDSYALGNLSSGAESSVGGLVGQSAGEVRSVYAVVPTYADDAESCKIGALIGNNVGNISGAYIINSAAAQSAVGSGSGDAARLSFEQGTRAVNFAALDFASTWTIEEYSTLPTLRGISQTYAPEATSATVILGVGLSSNVQLNSLKTRLTAYERPEIDRVELKSDVQSFMGSAPLAYSGAGLYRLWYPAYNNRGTLYIYQLEISVVNPDKLIVVTDCAAGTRDGAYLGEVRFLPSNVQLNYKLNGEPGSSTSLNVDGLYTELSAVVYDDFGNYAEKRLNDIRVELAGGDDFDYVSQVLDAFDEAYYSLSFDRLTAALGLFSELGDADRASVLRVSAEDYYALLTDRISVERLQREVRALPSLDMITTGQLSSKYNALTKSARSFFDSTPEGRTLRDSVEYLGTQTGEAPRELTILRSEFLQLLYESSGSPAVFVSGVGPFSDVTSDTPYYGAVIWGNFNGLANGVGGGKFDPYGEFSWEQAATLLALYSGEAIDPGGGGSLEPGQASAWAAPYVEWAISRGLVSADGFEGKVRLGYSEAVQLLSLAS
ncbi:MAG: S-layer homology domain-containing protein [Oscillospiraceae bacterium]|nr:S-layer homology domain-containing protein [Oscillospiraceae bacterium]